MYKRKRSAGDAEPPLRRRLYAGGYRKSAFQPFLRTARMTKPQMLQLLARGPRSILPAEKKFMDISHSGALSIAVDWTGAEEDNATMLCLNAVAQGAGNSQRVGLKYAIYSLEVTGCVNIGQQADQTASDSAVPTFVACVWDKQTNGAQLNSEDVYTNPAGVFSSLPSPLRNMSYSKRFKVLRTFQHVLKPPTLAYDGTNMEQGGDLAQFHWMINFPKPVIVECKGTSNTVADIVNHSFHVIGVAGTESPSPTAEIQYNARIRYTDV